MSTDTTEDMFRILIEEWEEVGSYLLPGKRWCTHALRDWGVIEADVAVHARGADLRANELLSLSWTAKHRPSHAAAKAKAEALAQLLDGECRALVGAGLAEVMP